MSPRAQAAVPPHAVARAVSGRPMGPARLEALSRLCPVINPEDQAAARASGRHARDACRASLGLPRDECALLYTAASRHALASVASDY